MTRNQVAPCVALGVAIAACTLCLTVTVWRTIFESLPSDQAPRTAAREPEADSPSSTRERNGFRAEESTRAALAQGGAGAGASSLVSREPKLLSPCTGSERLMALVGAENPAESVARIAQAGEEPHSYRTGQRLGAAHIAEIRPSHVVLQQPDGNHCFLTLFASTSYRRDERDGERARRAPTDRPVTPPIIRPRARAPSGFTLEELAAGIVFVADGRYRIRSDLARELAEAAHAVWDTVELVPLVEPEAPPGVELRNVEQGDALDKLGLRDGDVLTDFDGRPIDSAAAVYAAHSALGDADVLTLSLRRHGEALTLSYEIEPEGVDPYSPR